MTSLLKMLLILCSTVTLFSTAAFMSLVQTGLEPSRKINGDLAVTLTIIVAVFLVFTVLASWLKKDSREIRDCRAVMLIFGFLSYIGIGYILIYKAECVLDHPQYFAVSGLALLATTVLAIVLPFTTDYVQTNKKIYT